MTDPIVEALDATALPPRPEFRQQVMELSRTDDEPARADVILSADSNSGWSRRRSTWLAIAAAVVLGIGGAMVLVGRDPAPDPVVQPVPSASTAATTLVTATTAPETTPPSTTHAPSSTTAATTSTSVPVTFSDKRILRGDGLAGLPFGSARADVVAALTEAFGAPDPDDVAPEMTATPIVNGCGNRSQSLSYFGNLIVGFSDTGAGSVLDAWSISFGVEPDVPSTEDGVSVGVTVEEMRESYGEAFVSAAEAGVNVSWAGIRNAATLTVDGGELVLVELARPGQFDIITAGGDCGLQPLPPPPPPTTPFPDERIDAVIDLTRPAPALEPTFVASRPWSTTDGIPDVVVAPAGDRQIAVLDATTGIVEFLDVDTGEIVGTVELPITADAKPCCWMFAGPDDVLYINQVDNGVPEFVAYALTDDGFREVARTMHGTGDSTLMLGTDGITGLGNGPAVMPFVGPDGRPSAATLDIEPILFAPDGDGIRRGDSAWRISYIGAGCEGCSGVQPGPGETLIVTDGLAEQSAGMRIVLLDGTSKREWDSTWWYVGPIDDGLVMQRIADNRIEIGVVPI